jgi:foldase protein PrsA
MHTLLARIRALALLSVLAVAAIAATGCGDDVPSGAVAKVGDEVITKSEFDHFLAITARQQSQGVPGAAATVPDAPDFKRCVAEKAKQPVPQGAAKPQPDALKKQCQEEYDSLKDQTMQFLIQAEWLLQEAEDRGVKTTDAEVRKRLDDEKKQAFPKEKDYQDYLKQTGQTQQDIEYRVKLSILTQLLQEKVVESGADVSDADVERYYNEHKDDYAQPETRDLLVIQAKNEAEAKKALAALKDDKEWKDVAKRYSQDPASRSEGGRLPAVTRGQQEKALDDAIFGAKPNELRGPIRTQFGWYVFRVTKVKAKKQQTLEEVRESIRNQLKSQRQQEVLNDFVEDYEKKHKEETKCAEDFAISSCDNGPDDAREQPASGAPPQQGAPQGGAPPTGAPPTGAPPQGAPPQGAPPQGAPPQGAPPQGAPPQGAPPQGAPPQGAPPQGAPPQGAPPQP